MSCKCVLSKPGSRVERWSLWLGTLRQVTSQGPMLNTTWAAGTHGSAIDRHCLAVWSQHSALTSSGSLQTHQERRWAGQGQRWHQRHDRPPSGSSAGHSARMRAETLPTRLCCGLKNVPASRALPCGQLAPRRAGTGLCVLQPDNQAGLAHLPSPEKGPAASHAAAALPAGWTQGQLLPAQLGRAAACAGPSAVACSARREESAVREWLNSRRSSRAATPARSAACSAPPAFISCRSTAQHSQHERPSAAALTAACPAPPASSPAAARHSTATVSSQGGQEGLEDVQAPGALHTHKCTAWAAGRAHG